MSRRHYDLPPLTTLIAFESAARHLSFKDAAQELSVTPGAVSHQIKALEAELETALFLRLHRGVELTEAGTALYETLSVAFSKMSQQLGQIRHRTAGRRVTLGSTTAIAALWLSSCVIRFWRQHPDQDVNQVAQDRLFRNRADIDLFIRYGENSDTGLIHTPLYRDQLVPVGNPELAEKLGNCSLEQLGEQRLIYLESEDRSWTTWPEWFRELGHTGPLARGVRVNRYSVALQVAQDGGGLALGWKRLVRPLLDSGKLVPVGPYIIDAPHKFYLVGRPDEELSAGAQALKSWIIQEVDDALV
ncbi:MAG: LysR substrate-binding domain-containing protein [Pseudomonadota bacterium]